MTSAVATWLMQDSAFNPLGFMFSGAMLSFGIVIVLIVVIGGWKVFTKAGQPGWAIIIPIYNAYILLKIAGRPGWWLLLYFVPIVNFIIAIVVAMDVAKAFGQSALWGFLLLFLLGGIGYLILGFGSARYLGPPNAMAMAAR